LEKDSKYFHKPVLLKEVIEVFKNIEGYFVDCTLGLGGHTEEILKTNPKVKAIGIDKDVEAIEFAKERLRNFKERVVFCKGNFSKEVERFLNLPIRGLLADLGVSSLHLDKKERGFSFDSENLDMRMDKKQKISAYDIVNFYNKEELQRILKEFGEVREYRKISELIIKNRPFKSAKELSDIIGRKNFYSKTHPATKIFQAIRIEVNEELKEIEKLLNLLEKKRPDNLIVAIISFHSLEDRIVKNRFKRWSKKCICPPEAMKCICSKNNELGKTLTKKPITPSEVEIRKNPRSRSAKMRVFAFKNKRSSFNER